MSSDDPHEGPLADEMQPRAIVAGHGDFASGIVSAVEQITGRGSVFIPLSNRGLGGDQISDALQTALVSSHVRVVFTDLPAGSWTLAARRLQREHPDMVLVTGANLPALLDFLFQTDAAADVTAGRAADKGRGALMVVHAR